ncbi:MAG: histidine kinase dimerization/phospho-acceptor domain-containing protein, partial [Oscillospiraceae bacterium]
MLKKLSIRLRLTLLSGILLTLCCVGLTVVLNFSAFRLVDKIDATIITTPAIESDPSQNKNEMNQEIIPLTPSTQTQEAKKGFSIQSIIYMIIVILGGSALTYYISGRALKPLDILNGQVKNLNVHNLSETLDIPPTKDEIAELTQSFNDMTDKLDEAFLTQKRFSASAAHELRTPLAVLQTKVDVFKKKNTHTNEEYEALIAVFEKQINRLRGLVSNLLDMTNMDDEREQSAISLQDMFEDIIS